MNMIFSLLGLVLLLFAAAAALLAWKRQSDREQREAAARRKLRQDAEREYQAHLAQLCWNYRAKHARRTSHRPLVFPPDGRAS